MRDTEKGQVQKEVEQEFSQSAPASDLALSVVFFLGGVYMIFAFSSFWIFVIGFFCLVLGVAGASGSLPEGRTNGWLRSLDASTSSASANGVSSPSGEKELLCVLQEKGSSSPAEAALATSLAIREADVTLSDLASRGYLTVESDGGTLFYSIPKRESEG